MLLGLVRRIQDTSLASGANQDPAEHALFSRVRRNIDASLHIGNELAAVNPLGVATKRATLMIDSSNSFQQWLKDRTTRARSHWARSLEAAIRLNPQACRGSTC